jgi:hypothetical protein
MTTIRKWRFPILIGAGLIAAGSLFYFSSYRINPEKTQGAIGKRDVYRDGQVASADVASPGSAPVAVKAVLESGEFKALAKDPAFQEMLKSDSFTQLSTDAAFVRLLSDLHFQSMTQAFAGLIHNSATQGSSSADSALFAGLAQNAQYSELVHSSNFQGMMHQQAFMNLMRNSSFQQMMRNSQFTSLVSQSSFQNALLSGNAANLMHGLRLN